MHLPTLSPLRISSLCVGAALLSLTSCGHAHETTDADDEKHSDAVGEIHFSKEQIKAAGLQTETVSAAPFQRVIKAGGQLQAPAGDEHTVVATAAGIVAYAKSGLVEGSAVRSGEALMRLSAKDLQEGDPVVKADIAYEAALKAYQRAQRLVADKIISEREMEEIKANYEAARADHEAQNAHRSAGSVTVGAAISGYVKRLLVAPGEYVAVGQPLAVVTSTRRVQLRVMVPERYYSLLGQVTTAHFTTSVDGTNVYRLSDLNGRLVSYGKSVADGTAFIPVVFEFDNVGDFLPGSGAEVYLLGAAGAPVLSVPLTALTEEEGLYFVYVQVDDDGFMKRQVTLGQSDGERREVLSGLKSGERVVTRGAYRVKMAASASSAVPHSHNH